MSAVNAFHHLSFRLLGIFVSVVWSPDLFSLIEKKALQSIYSSLTEAIFLSLAQKMPRLQMEGTPQSGHVQWFITGSRKEKEEVDRCEERDRLRNKVIER